jgi:phenylacetate-CoA ligase
MVGYFAEADAAGLLAEYPVGGRFMDGPARLSRDELHDLRERRFLAVMRRGWQVPFYRRLWGAVGIEPGDIRTLADISKLPPFSKSDLMASVEQFPPYGDFHGVDFADNASRPSFVLHTTSGTTGAPQPLFFGARDREIQNILLARAYRLQGLRDSDVVHSVYGFGMVNGGHYIREAILHFTRAVLLPAGTGLETPSEQQVDLMRRFGATVLVGFADYLKRLAEVARDKGLVPGRDIPVRMISGHLGQESREAISDLWGGAAVYDWYGVGDTGTVAAEGPLQNGLYVWEDAHIVEILDPDTLAPVPEGEAGAMCITVLFKDGVYPVIRFNTSDVSRLLPPDPASGINFRRLPGFLGRSDNMVKLRGINVYPTAIGALLDDLDGLTGEYVCRVDRDGNRDRMTVLVEVESGVEDPARRDAIAAHLRHKLGVEVSVELAGPGATAALTQIERRQKPIRLLDER